MKKKLLSIGLVASLAATAVVGGTLAYFTDKEDATNTFTVGNVDITLTEESWNPPTDTYPGQVIAKDPVVTNVGANNCYVRIKIDDSTWTQVLTGTTDGIIYSISEDPKAITDTYGTDWVEYQGYFYYTPVLEEGKETSALFKYIKIPTSVITTTTGSDANSYDIKVFAEAVQADGSNLPAITKDNVEELAAWFTTCME